ncbi:MAG: hypothetical protein GXW91_07970, partial [Clostridiales bacterium]|nr:hypothetical protein [Clostridiales bacterium]
ENCLSSTAEAEEDACPTLFLFRTAGIEEDACPTMFLFTLYSQCLRAACLFQFRWILGNCLGTRDIRTYGLA